MMKRKTSTAAALIGLAFLLGTAVVGCEKETETTTVPVAGAPGPQGAAGAQGAPGAAAAPAPAQASEKTSESSTTTTNDNSPGGNTTTTDKSTTTKTN